MHTIVRSPKNGPSVSVGKGTFINDVTQVGGGGFVIV